ncbi:phosphodiester glycosidase family protein, partial [Myxococcota bacterium]|nr:phosphodiester glycosidase family protein [Myxococcota bacterium]
MLRRSHAPSARLTSFASITSLALIALTVIPGAAHAADVWTDPFPGIRYLHRSTNEPKEIHALLVDLTRPEISLRATRDGEKGRTTTSFSNLVGAAAAVNGDFYNTNGSYDPVGLAIGEGTVWSDDTTGHHFLACTAAKACEIETTAQATTPPASWHSAVGGNRLLVVGGQIVQTPSDDTACGSFCTTQHPRTAAGISADGGTLILVVVEGRQDPIFGMTTARLAELMQELGAHVALNLDGGGSSAMVVSGTRVSGRPANEPSERAVANHLAVVYDASAATTGRLVGFVREHDITDANANLAGADVVLSTGERTTTGSNGMYEFAEVPAGPVDVTASMPGYTTVTMSKTITAGITNWRSIALERAAPDAGTSDASQPAPDASAPDAGADDAATSPDAEAHDAAAEDA